MKLISRQEMQWIDHTAIHQYGIPSLVLMENAGRAVSDYIIRELNPSKNRLISLVCGKGNNGGDGLVIARHLQENGFKVRVYLLFSNEEYQGDPQFNLDRFEGEVFEVTHARALRKIKEDLKSSDLVVDAIFGTGLDRPIQGFLAEVIRQINSLKKTVLAVDIPSGLCANTGSSLGVCIRATYTCTFHLPKIGLVLGPDIENVGALQVFPIGIPKLLKEKIKRRVFLITPELFSTYFHPREKDTHKNKYGHVLTVAGSKRKIGAALLTARAALRAGAGLSTLALPECAYEKINPKYAEIMFEPLPFEGDCFSGEDWNYIAEIAKNKKVIACGPGMGVSHSCQKLVREMISNSRLPLVLDADALNNLAAQRNILKKRKAPLVLTPHPGEMQRLTGLSKNKLLSHRLTILRKFSQHYEVYTLLKGHRSLIATPSGDIFVNSTGNPGMATAGTGDVLTGIIAGFVAQGIPFEKAILAAIWVHGKAGDKVATQQGEAGMLAWDIAEKVPEVMRDLICKADQ